MFMLGNLLKEHNFKMETKEKTQEDWSSYGRCQKCQCLSVEDIGTDEAPQYFCRVCKALYTNQGSEKTQGTV